MPSPTSNENCISTVRELLQQKVSLIVPTEDFHSATRLGKTNSNKKNILIKMKSFSGKLNIIKACKAKKPNFYANDDLPAEKQTIMYVIRETKRKFPAIVFCFLHTSKMRVTRNLQTTNRRIDASLLATFKS